MSRRIKHPGRTNPSPALAAEQAIRRTARDAVAAIVGEEEAARLSEFVERDCPTPREDASGELYVTIAMDYDLDQDSEDAELFGPGGWRPTWEADLLLGDNLLVADIAGWRRERMPTWPDTYEFTIAPDWVCEVVGHGGPELGHREKRAVYAAAGITDLWVVDLASHTIESWQLVDGSYALQKTVHDNERTRLDPFNRVGICPAMIM